MAAITWLASYPKSGNTWLRFMLASYLTKQPVTSVRVRSLNSLIPIIGGGSGSNTNGLPEDHTGPLVVKTHSLPGATALRPYRSDTRKAVYLVRNPRDIILSLTNAKGARNMSAEDIAKDFIANRGMPLSNTEYEWGNWPQNVRCWTTPGVARQHFPDIDVLTVRYEDMRADPVAALHHVLDFVDPGQPVVAEDAALAVESSSLDNMHALWEKDEPIGPGRRPAKKFRAGQGLSNQSLARLSPDIENEYRKLFQTDDDFAQCARTFGYHG
jgi:Sulfotransferase domain